LDKQSKQGKKGKRVKEGKPGKEPKEGHCPKEPNCCKDAQPPDKKESKKPPCCDQVKMISVNDLIENCPTANWQVHAKLPAPCLVQACAVLSLPLCPEKEKKKDKGKEDKADADKSDKCENQKEGKKSKKGSQKKEC